MRKIVAILTIMFMFAGMVSAQQRSKQASKKVDAKKVAAKTVSTEEHLCFEGVPIDGTTEDFIKTLAKKGIKGVTEKESDTFIYKGRKCKTLLNGLKQSDFIYSVMICYYFTVNEYNKADLFIKNAIKNIKLKYKCKYTPYHYYSENAGEWGSQNVYSLYSNTNKKIGDFVYHIFFDEMGGVVNFRFIDYSNAVKYGKDNYEYCDSEIEWEKYPYTIKGFSTVNVGKEKYTGNVFIKAFSNDSPNKTYKFTLIEQDKHIFYNLTQTCKDTKLRDYFINNLFERIKEVIEYPEDTYVIPDILRNNVQWYYSKLEREKKERERQLAQRRKSYGFMDLMHMLAPGFFTQDDVELWNKLPESDQKAVINGTFGAYFGMGDTRGHTEKMHTPSLRNQE